MSIRRRLLSRIIVVSLSPVCVPPSLAGALLRAVASFDLTTQEETCATNTVC